MPGATSGYGLPYLEPDDPPDIAGGLQSLAEAVETELQALDDALNGPPVAQLRQTSQQTITNGSWSALNFQAEDVDTHNGHDNSTNPSRYVCKKAGIYLVTGGVAYSGFTSGTGWVRVAKNGTDVPGSGANSIYTTSQLMIPVRPVYVTLALTDYVEIHTTYVGANINTYVGASYAQSSMSVQWVHA